MKYLVSTSLVGDPSFRPLPLDLSETASQLEDPQQSLQDKVSDFLARLHQDSINLSLDIPKPRPFPGKKPEICELSWVISLFFQEEVFI